MKVERAKRIMKVVALFRVKWSVERAQRENCRVEQHHGDSAGDQPHSLLSCSLPSPALLQVSAQRAFVALRLALSAPVFAGRYDQRVKFIEFRNVPGKSPLELPANIVVFRIVDWPSRDEREFASYKHLRRTPHARPAYSKIESAVSGPMPNTPISFSRSTSRRSLEHSLQRAPIILPQKSARTISALRAFCRQ